MSPAARPALLVAATLLVLCGAVGARAQEETGSEGGWIDRTLRRYFGGRSQLGEVRAGEATQLVDRYLPHAGKPIEVVLVYAVTAFDEDWDADKDFSTRTLNSLTRPLHSYTKDGLVRQYLLFERGQPLDPFALADSERLLRNLESINDVRISVVSLGQADDESVAVVVEIRDRWPFGAAGKIKDFDWYEASLYATNLGGYGYRFDTKLLYRKGFSPELGFRSTLRKENLGGSFIRAALEYEDSWRELRRYADVRRDLEHPNIRWVGGFGYENTDDRDNEGIPRKFREGDLWVGHAYRLDPRPADEGAARKVLVPGVRFLNRGFQDRPEVRPDTNGAYHDLRSYMAGLTFRRIKNFRTSYLFRMGEIENVPAGLVLKATGGYEDGEFNNRTFVFLQQAYSSVRNRGDVVFFTAGFGGFFRSHRFEDGVFRVAGTYITPLWGGQGRYRHRWYGRMEYVRGIDRVDPRGLMLGNRTGLRDMEDNKVYGEQRLIAQLESRLFTPWRLWGFHIMVFGFLDAGTLTGEDDPTLQGKIYTSTGLGLRFNNPDLVLSTLQVRLGVLNSIEGRGLVFAFKTGNPDYPLLEVPSIRPGGFAFE